MADIILRRRSNKGKAPTILTINIDQKTERWRTTKPAQFLTKQDKDKILRTVLEILISKTFGCHIYRWEGRVFRQVSGGSIGLRGTGSAAKMTMDSWIEKYRKLLEDNGIEIFLLVKYVDDIFVICRTIPTNLQWD